MLKKARNWKYKLDLSFISKVENPTDKDVADLGDKVNKKLFFLTPTMKGDEDVEGYIDELDDLADKFKYCDNVVEFDEFLAELYDIGDMAGIWIDTISGPKKTESPKTEIPKSKYWNKKEKQLGIKAKTINPKEYSWPDAIKEGLITEEGVYTDKALNQAREEWLKVNDKVLKSEELWGATADLKELFPNHNAVVKAEGRGAMKGFDEYKKLRSFLPIVKEDEMFAEEEEALVSETVEKGKMTPEEENQLDLELDELVRSVENNGGFMTYQIMHNPMERTIVKFQGDAKYWEHADEIGKAAGRTREQWQKELCRTCTEGSEENCAECSKAWTDKAEQVPACSECGNEMDKHETGLCEECRGVDKQAKGKPRAATVPLADWMAKNKNKKEDADFPIVSWTGKDGKEMSGIMTGVEGSNAVIMADGDNPVQKVPIKDVMAITKDEGKELPKHLRPKFEKEALKVWKAKLQDNYDSFEEFERYDEMYSLSERLGFDSPQKAWEANPLIQGSTNPEDFKKVEKSSGKGSDLPSYAPVKKGDTVIVTYQRGSDPNQWGKAKGKIVEVSNFGRNNPKAYVVEFIDDNDETDAKGRRIALEREEFLTLKEYKHDVSTDYTFERKSAKRSDEELSNIADHIRNGQLYSIDISYTGEKDWTDEDYQDIVAHDTESLEHIAKMIEQGMVEGELNVLYIEYADPKKVDHSADVETEERGWWKLARKKSADWKAELDLTFIPSNVKKIEIADLSKMVIERIGEFQKKVRLPLKVNVKGIKANFEATESIDEFNASLDHLYDIGDKFGIQIKTL